MFSRVVVTAPPGKLGIQVVDDATNEVHTVISKVSVSSIIGYYRFQYVLESKIDGSAIVHRSMMTVHWLPWCFLRIK